ETGQLTPASSWSLTSTCPHHKGVEPSPGWLLSTKPTATGSDCSTGLQNHSRHDHSQEVPGGEKWAESTLPGFYTPPGSPRGLYLDEAELTAGQVLYTEWNLLDAASRINFSSLVKNV
uniref:Uncharacterized protein n=1 Tax=Saimiri boliviensis boliviensis TaxID=39432 RepID=A0A2K6V0L8_SAIBB